MLLIKGAQHCKLLNRQEHLYMDRNCIVLGSMYNQGVVRARSWSLPRREIPIPTAILSQNPDSTGESNSSLFESLTVGSRYHQTITGSGAECSPTRHISAGASTVVEHWGDEEQE